MAKTWYGWYDTNKKNQEVNTDNRKATIGNG